MNEILSKFNPSELIDEINMRRPHPERVINGDLTKEDNSLAFAMLSVLSDCFNSLSNENSELRSRLAVLERGHGIEI